MGRVKNTKGNKGKKGSKMTPDSSPHSQTEAEAKGKKESKMTPEAARHRETEAEANAKKETKMTPEAARHSETEAEATGKIGSKMTPEAAGHGKSQTKAKLEDESKVGGTDEILLQGEWDPKELAVQGFILFPTDPYKIHYDIYRFICHWVYAFMWAFAITFVVIILSGNQLLRTNFDETLWKIVTAICFLYLIGAVIALLALKQLPGLLIFFLKFAGIFSFLIAGIFTVLILTTSNLYDIILDETFVKTMNSIIIIWWILIISLVATVITINDASQLKTELRCFKTFIFIWGFIFLILLTMLMCLVVIFENNLFGIGFDEIFFKIATSICVMQGIASTSGAYVHYFQRNDPDLFRLAA